MGPETAKAEVGNVSDADIEQEIQDKKLTALRITPQTIGDAILDESYQRIKGTTVTVCVLSLRNSFTVVGHSACVSEENFNAELGAKIARQKAFNKCWELLGFQLASEQSGFKLTA